MKSGPQLYLQCDWCHGFFRHNGGKRKRWCSDAHKQAAWRADNSLGGDNAKYIPPTPAVQTHECVAGFIYGVVNDDGVCNSCGRKLADSVRLPADKQ